MFEAEAFVGSNIIPEILYLIDQKNTQAIKKTLNQIRQKTFKPIFK